MLTITCDLKSCSLRQLSALINYLEDKYLKDSCNKTIKNHKTYRRVSYSIKDITILQKAASLELEFITNKSYKDVFNKEQTFTRDNLLEFVNKLYIRDVVIDYSIENKPKLTKERLQFMYADCVNKLYKLAVDTFPKCEGNIARKINHYRQLLANNRDTWDYLSVKDMPSVDFYLKYNYVLKGISLDLNPELSIKQLMYKIKQKLVNKPYTWTTTQPPVTAPRTIEWELEQYAKHKAAKVSKNKYKMTITDCATGDVVQEFYLPKS